MKVIGIEINKKRAISVVLSKDELGNYINLTGKDKYVEIIDDQKNEDVQTFLKEIHNFFDTVKPDHIAIITRQTKGKFAAAAVSFKLEALIQCYSKATMSFVSKQTLTAYYKKNELPVSYANTYQENATRLAAYLLR
ncbi:DUF3010 family protein [Aquimarina sp. MMG015]|uniref:DUF3010 family protein n=1 Tax=unclassified Aquimarina TaxID=2627091 RepID=UPI000E5220EE|nr:MULTISPECIES: DUF3010 family protein [unclassified Aquimarina]AXT56482.1 DUF3010 family protein [Aquimarina sp. AD1]MBQ4803403.1 DUF3010 family protein [Aquimarina sp. MMG015]RKN23491.1 DUF3010 family protein [Aquimarina sp. AD1]